MARKIKKENGIKLIIGLGNPEKEYQNSFHNIGFLFLNYFTAEKSNFLKPKNKNFKYLKKNNLIFAWPLSFMNASGPVVLEMLKYFKLSPLEILIVHDDIDIELGKYKLSFGRGDAGHYGIRSIINSLKTKNFWRLRLGIKASKQKIKAGDLVLKKIPATTQKIFQKVFEEIKKSFPQILKRLQSNG